MPTYELVDEKGGGTFQFDSPRELSNDELLKMKDRYFAQADAPPTESELPPGGPEPGSAVSVGRSVIRNAPAIALSAALPEVAGPLIGAGGVPASAGVLAARAGLAGVGGAIGQTAGSLALGEPPPSGMQTGGDAVTSAVTQFMFDAAGKALFTKSGKVLLAERLADAGTFGQGLVPEAAGGRIIKDVLPKIDRTVTKTSNRFYAKVRAFGRQIPARPQPDAITKTANDLLAGLPVQTDQAVPDQLARVRKVLQRISDRGAPQTQKSSILGPNGQPVVSTTQPRPTTFNDLLRDHRELQEELGKYQDRFHPNTVEGGIFKRLSDSVYGEIIKRAKGSPAEQAMVEAAANFRHNVVPFREGFNAAMTDAIGPSDVIDVYARAGRPDRLASLYKQLPDVEKQQFSAAWFTKTMQESFDQTSHVFQPEEFLRRWKNLGVDSQRIITQGRATQIDGLVGRLATLQRRADLVAKTAKFTGAAATVGALGTALHSFANGNVSDGFAYLVGSAAPFILPQILADPRMVKFANEGMQAPQGSKIAVRYGKQIAQTLSHTMAALTKLTEPTQAPGNPTADVITSGEM